MRFSGITGALTGKIITKVSLQAWAQAATGGLGTPTLSLNPIVQIDGVRWKGPTVALDSNNPLHFLNHELPFNPISGLSWKIADVEKFAADADSFVGWEFSPTGSVNFVQRIFSAWLRVDWGTTERRVAVGALNNPVAFTRTLAFLATPAGVDNWAKTSGVNYLILIRRRSGTGSIAVRWLDSGKPCPHASHSSPLVGFGADGQLDIFQTDVTNRLTKAYDLSMARTDATGSADTQPYGSVNGDGGTGEIFVGADMTQVWGGFIGQQQEFTAPASAKYQSIQVLVRGQSNLLPPDAPLSIKVRVRSGGAQVGGELLIQPGELKAPYNSWRIIRGNITPAALTNTTQYFFDITSNATEDRQWQVQVLSGMENNNAYDTHNFGGLVDRFTWFTASDVQYADAVISIAQAVTNVTGFAATAQDLTLASPSDWPMSITEMQKVRLSWTKTSHGANFMQYEIERLNPFTAQWENISIITNENTQAIDDLGGGVGVLGSYRIRTIRTTGAASDWSSTATATPQWGNFKRGLLFVSNENPALSCGFLTEGPAREYQFINAETEEIHKYQGRNYQVVFRPMEERGIGFEQTVFINAEVVPAIKGPRVFQALRDICHAHLSHVIVKDPDGNVFLASVRLIGGVQEDLDYYRATVSILETTDVPAPVTA
jgi:hypothetical protein